MLEGDAMTDEEYFIKNYPEYTTPGGALLSPYWDLFSAGYELAENKLKCCGNCGNKRCTSKYRGNSAYHTQKDGFACADNEDWEARE